MTDKVKFLVEHYNMIKLPVENTYISEDYRSKNLNEEGRTIVTTMYGLYCNNPVSVSCFHKLDSDEVWTFFEGDPIYLYLLYEDGRTDEVILGNEIAKGHIRQYVIPRNVIQGGCLCEEGEYALYGCTVSPGFVPFCFEAFTAQELIKKYPQMEETIRKLSINGNEKFMPDLCR